MDILFLIRSLDYGGAERQLCLLAQTLAGRGHGVSVAVFYAGGPLAAELAASGVAVHDLRKGGRWDILSFLWRLARLVRRLRPQIVHGYLPVANILAALVAPLVPGCRVVFGVRASDMELGHYDRLAAAAYGLEARFASRAHAIISNSRAGYRAAVARGCPAHSFHVVSNGIDTDRFRPDRALGAALRAEWGGGDGQRLVGMVARIDPMKGHDTFLRAAAAALTVDPKLRFICVGAGERGLEDQLRAQAVTLGVPVIWAPPRTDAAAIYNALDLFVLASTYGEGFPNVLAEAMACGVACVATRVGDAEEVLGGTGTVVDAGDADAMAQAIVEAPRGLQAETRLRVVEIYSVDRLAQSTEALLAELVR